MEGAERIAEAVAKYDVDRFIHVSSYNANPDSPSEFFRTKVGSTYLTRLLLVLINDPGPRRGGGAQHISRNNHSSPCPIIWLRGSTST